MTFKTDLETARQYYRQREAMGGMSLNLDLIRDRFQDIWQSLERLEQIRALSRDEFLADQDTLDIAMNHLVRNRWS